MKIPTIAKPNSKGIFQFVFLLILLSSNCIFSQFTIPEKPSFQTSVYDYANLLNPDEKKQLDEKLIKYSDSTTTQIVVITIESLKNESVDQLATNWAQKWGLGQEKEDNGVIILLAKSERKIAIHAGYGLEDRLTAAIGGQIIDYIIVPEFKAGSYYRGLDKGTDALFDVFKDKYKGTRKQAKQEQDFPVLPFIIIIVFILILASRNKGGGGNSGNRGGGPSLLDAIILSNLGRNSGGFGSGGFGGGSSGGGFGGGGFGGGFGGGGFSGGGSSGSW